MIISKRGDETYLYCPISLFSPLPYNHKGIQLTTYMERENLDFLLQHTKLLPEKTMEDCDCYGECIPDKDQSEQDTGEMSF